MLEMMYGPGGKIVAWAVPCNEHTVVFGYGSKEYLRETITAVKDGKAGLADDEGVAKSAALLPRRAAWRFYVSPQGVFSLFKRVIVAAAPPGANLGVIPEFGQTPPVAMGLVTGENEVELQTIVPAEVLKEVGRLIGQNMPGGGAF
jgi:hypothetical protein